jgi:hypothetical protein
MQRLLTFSFLSSAILILSLASPLTAQTTFQRTCGGTEYDGGRSVTQTTDGGYVIAGYTESFGAGDYDVWLIKTNASGNMMWTRTWGGTDRDVGHSVAQTAYGGYVIAGYTWSFGAGSSDVYLIKTDASGNTMWTRTFGGAGSDAAYSVALTTDGGYIIAGVTTCFGSGDDVWLIKTNAWGDTMWTRTFGGGGFDAAYSVVQTADGGHVVAGRTCSDVWLIKTNAYGDTIWTHTYGGTNLDIGRSVRQTADGGYVVAGYTRSFGAGYYDVYLVKTDAYGDTFWTRTYGGTDRDYGHSVQQTTDGGYIVAGRTFSFGAYRGDVYLVKTDAYGDTTWTRTFGGLNWDKGYSVHQTTDGGYVITGYTKSFGAGRDDVWLIKTDSAGRIADATKAEPPIVHRPATTIIRHVLNLERGIYNPESEILLLDCVGRKVMDLQPGDNDVRHLAPGVYFVRPAGTVPASGIPGDSPFRAKVILTR